VNKRPPRNGETVKKIQNTLLVDGNALFKRAFAGAKDEYNDKGEFVGALYQFITLVRKMLVEDLYHRVYIFWDGKISGLERFKIYNQYKSNRNKDFVNLTENIDEDQAIQLEKIWIYLNEFYVRQFKYEFIEGDDLIAYYCLNKEENEKITICTNDTDMAQLINEDIKIYFLHLKNYVDIINFSSYFSYHVGNAALIKTMIGDDSDMIKGIKGLGLKTLLQHFPQLKERVLTINEIIDEAKLIQKNRIDNKKKPLSVLDNIINSVTDGVQGDKIYEINDKLVNLKNPMISKGAILELEDLKNGTLYGTDRSIKRIAEYMHKDGIDKILGEVRNEDYLIPFKKLIEREKNLI
jgi:5'-3' exonuclease